MRQSILFFLLVLTISTVDAQKASAEWISRYEQALVDSKRDNKLILLNFWSPTNEACRRMEIETWAKDTVVSMLKGFIPTRINIDTDNNVATQFGVTAIPAIVLVDGYQIPIVKLQGPATSTKLTNINDTPSSITLSNVTRLLYRYPKDITLINEAQRNYADNQDDIMALFDLAEAYLFTSLDAKQSAKTNFIVESKTYLVRTKKRLKKSKNTSLKQRYEIMNLVHEAFRTKPNKGIEKLLDYQKSNKVFPENVALFNAGLYTGYMTINQKRKANAVLEKIRVAEDNERFLKALKIEV